MHGRQEFSGDQKSLRRNALILVWVGLLWNPLEALVALPAGASSGSVALMAFGIKSLIELFAGAVLVWRIGKEWNTQAEGEAAEKKAERIIGITFLLLAAYIAVNSFVTLAGWFPEPEPSLVGIVISVASAVVMSILYVGKMRIAVPMQSRALRGEAIESLMCDLQDLTILVGLGANALLGWWWADPVAALAMIPFLVKEGREALVEQEEEEQRRSVCFCKGCFYGFRTCRLACCQAAPQG